MAKTNKQKKLFISFIIVILGTVLFTIIPMSMQGTFASNEERIYLVDANGDVVLNVADKLHLKIMNWDGQGWCGLIDNKYSDSTICLDFYAVYVDGNMIASNYRDKTYGVRGGYDQISSSYFCEKWQKTNTLEDSSYAFTSGYKKIKILTTKSNCGSGKILPKPTGGNTMMGFVPCPADFIATSPEQSEGIDCGSKDLLTIERTIYVVPSEEEPTICNNNNVCDNGETEENCPDDCKKEPLILPWYKTIPIWIFTLIGLIVSSILATMFYRRK